jgi:hypothetical protein
MRGIDDHDDRLRGHGGIFSGFGVGARQAGSSAMPALLPGIWAEHNSGGADPKARKGFFLKKEAKIFASWRMW